MRVGFGFDSHRIKKGGRLILGGINIKCDVGLAGFSDADVVIHALSDAILGAMSKRDIGEHFPDTDEVNKGRDSSDFIRYVKQIMDTDSYKVNNIDITIILERPHLSPYKQEIRDNLARILETEEKNISVKAKRTEGAFPEDTAVCFASVTLIKSKF